MAIGRVDGNGVLGLGISLVSGINSTLMSAFNNKFNTTKVFEL